MRDGREALWDGVATGVAASVLLCTVCLVTGRPVSHCGAWLFGGGAVLGVVSALWTIAGYRSPPGIIALVRDELEVFPAADEDSMWLDRTISVHNTWLVAGLVMLAASFLPPFLAT